MEKRKSKIFKKPSELWRIAFRYKNEGKFGLACRVFQRLAKEIPGSKDGWIARSMVGTCRFEMRQYLKCVEALRPVVKNLPKSFLARLTLGEALRNLGQFKEAIPVLLEACALKPDPVALTFLARCYSEIGNEIARKRVLERAVKVNPKYEEAQFNLGGYWHERKAFKKAEVRYRKAISLDPKYKMAHYQLGRVLIATSRTKEGERHHRTAAKLK